MERKALTEPDRSTSGQMDLEFSGWRQAAALLGFSLLLRVLSVVALWSSPDHHTSTSPMPTSAKDHMRHHMSASR